MGEGLIKENEFKWENFMQWKGCCDPVDHLERGRKVRDFVGARCDEVCLGVKESKG